MTDIESIISADRLSVSAEERALGVREAVAISYKSLSIVVLETADALVHGISATRPNATWFDPALGQKRARLRALGYLMKPRDGQQKNGAR